MEDIDNNFLHIHELRKMQKAVNRAKMLHEPFLMVEGDG